MNTREQSEDGTEDGVQYVEALLKRQAIEAGRVDCGPQPPIPVHIRNVLGNYPEDLQWLQRYLSDAVKKPLNEAQEGRAFSMAVWTLERAMDMLLAHARSELQAAEARGNAEAILIAHNRESCALLAGIRNRWIVDEELSRFCFYP